MFFVIMNLQLKLHPGSSREKVDKISNKKYEVWIKERAIEGKANLGLVKILKKYFRAKKVEIKKGFTSRNKVVEVSK